MTAPLTPDDPLLRARAVAKLLDSAVGVPGTGIRFGLDPVLGLVPGLGDLAGMMLSGYLVVLAGRLGAPRMVVVRMVANVAIDTLGGSVPLVGDLFDVAWKSNTRNLALLERSLADPGAARRTSRLAVVAALSLLLLFGAAAVALAVVVLRLVFRS